MKVLIAVLSCNRDVNNGANQAIRDTWASSLPSEFDCRFFIGAGKPIDDDELDPRFNWDVFGPNPRLRAEPEPLIKPLVDEVVLDTPDGYGYISWKVREMRRWSVERDYDFVFKIDTDTYLHAAILDASPFREFDYWGSRQQGPVEYAAGWSGYCLSRKACLKIDSAAIINWSEDVQTGFACKEAGIVLRDWGEKDIPTNNAYANPIEAVSWMRQFHRSRQ